jgi:hypothetical protein
MIHTIYGRSHRGLRSRARHVSSNGAIISTTNLLIFRDVPVYHQMTNVTFSHDNPEDEEADEMEETLPYSIQFQDHM